MAPGERDRARDLPEEAWVRRNRDYQSRSRRRFPSLERWIEAGCFPAGTSIWTPSGPCPIEHVCPGDEVWSPRVTGHARGLDLEIARVQRSRRLPSRRLWLVEFAVGGEDSRGTASLRTTACHSLLTTRGWVRAAKLRSGDELVGQPSGRRTVLRSLASAARTPVHNLIVAGPATFVAEGCVAHSHSIARGLRAWLAGSRARMRRALPVSSAHSPR